MNIDSDTVIKRTPTEMESRRHRRLFLAVIIILVSFIPVWQFTKNSYFFQDDFIFLKEAKTSRLTLRYLAKPVFQHFSPAYRFINFLAVRLFGMDYTKYYISELLIWAVSVACFAWAISIIIRKDLTWAIVVAVFAQSLSLIHFTIWWTATVNIEVSLALSVLVMGCYFRFRFSGNKSWATLSIIIYFLALFTHEQVWLILGYIGLFDLLLFHAKLTFFQKLKKCSLYWLPFIGLTAAAAINYFTRYYGVVKPSPTAWQMLQYFVIQLTQSFIPAVTGVRYWSQTTSNGILFKPSEFLFVMSYLLGITIVLALITYSLWGNRKLARPWIVFIIAYVTSSIMVGIDRVGLFGVNFGLVTDYIADMTWLFLFCFTFALRMKETDRATKTVTNKSRSRLWLLILLVIGFEASLCYSASIQNSHDFEMNLARTSKIYVNNFRNSAKNIKRNNFAILSTAVPDSVVGSSFSPYNQLGSIASLYGVKATFDQMMPVVYEANSYGDLIRVYFDSKMRPIAEGKSELISQIAPQLKLCNGASKISIPTSLTVQSGRDLWVEVSVLSSSAVSSGSLYVSYDTASKSAIIVNAQYSSSPYPILVNLNSSRISSLNLNLTAQDSCVAGIQLGIFNQKP